MLLTFDTQLRTIGTTKHVDHTFAHVLFEWWRYAYLSNGGPSIDDVTFVVFSTGDTWQTPMII